MEDEVILLESLSYKIIYLKRYAGPDEPCKNYTDAATTINIYRLAAYRPAWLTK